MPPRPSCSTCRHWLDRRGEFIAGGATPSTVGECHEGRPSMGSGWPVRSKFPGTSADDWCGRHETSQEGPAAGLSAPGPDLYPIARNGAA